MGINMSDKGFVSEAIMNHYTERAKGGAGLLIVEVSCVDAPQGLNSSNMLVIDDDKYIDGMSQLADSIHENGAKCLLQISHTGRGSRRKITGKQPVGPSAVAMPYTFMMGLSNEEPRELTAEEIRAIEDKYANAALRAKKAGFDGIQMHSIGYYLGEQFLSSKANVRTDEYGGSKEKRIQFHLNVVQKIRALCGDDFVVTVKLTVLELGEDAGITFEEGTYYAYRLQEAGIDALEVMVGAWKQEATLEDVADTGSPKGQMFDVSAGIKAGIKAITGKEVTIPIISGGRAGYAQVAEEALAKEKCEFVFMGKSLLAEPNLPNLILEKKEALIRPCIGCNTCIDQQLQHDKCSRCSSNAVLGNRHNRYELELATKTKKIAIIGGGIAAIEAARVATLRGHDVTIYEKDAEIGGQVKLAATPPHKENIKPMLDYFKAIIKELAIKVHYNRFMDEEAVLALNADVVICAVGPTPVKINLPGIDLPHVMEAKEALLGKNTGQNVVIIGGGVVGCETAEYLVEQGKQVTIVEATDKMAAKMVMTNRTILLDHLKLAGTIFMNKTKCIEISKSFVEVMAENRERQHILADTVLLSVGERPNPSLYDSLVGKVSEVYNIGDSQLPDCFATSIKQGHEVAVNV
ncbi:FAD-dependent oxidoreductase [Enterococcus rivorum]